MVGVCPLFKINCWEYGWTKLKVTGLILPLLGFANSVVISVSEGPAVEQINKTITNDSS